MESKSAGNPAEICLSLSLSQPQTNHLAIVPVTDPPNDGWLTGARGRLAEDLSVWVFLERVDVVISLVKFQVDDSDWPQAGDYLGIL